MTIHITTSDGRPIESRIHDILSNANNCLRKSGKLIQNALLWTARSHVKTIYPDSTHYSPDKIQPSDANDGTNASGSIDIDIPGICRAYHDHIISPKRSKYLTIPMHSSAYGKKASQFSDLFVITKKDGRKFLAQDNGKLTFMYRLATQVNQKRDSRLMPSDQTFADNIFARLRAYLDSQETQI